jgi:hypothetical protein
MSATQAQIEQARAILLSAAIAFYEGKIDNPTRYLDPHWGKLGFLLSATAEEAEVMVRADRFSRTEKSRLEGPDYLIYLDILMVIGEIGDSITLLRQAFWMKTFIAYTGTIEEQVSKRHWRDYEATCRKYLREARRTGSPVCLIRPLVRLAHALLMTGDLTGCARCLDEFDTTAELAPDGPGADLVPVITAAEWTARMRREADELRQVLPDAVGTRRPRGRR